TRAWKCRTATCSATAWISMSRGATCRASMPSGNDVGGTIDLAVIGGTGLYALAGLEGVETLQPETKYGAPSGPVRIGTLGGARVAFLARHGEGHSVPPHKVNYRANLAALQALGTAR